MKSLQVKFVRKIPNKNNMKIAKWTPIYVVLPILFLDNRLGYLLGLVPFAYHMNITLSHGCHMHIRFYLVHLLVWYHMEKSDMHVTPM